MNDEQREILREFRKLLIGPTVDGQNKRRDGNKPLWKVDKSHEDAMRRHLHRYDRGELVDEHSGSHPLVHVAWRALALAYQQTVWRDLSIEERSQFEEFHTDLDQLQRDFDALR